MSSMLATARGRAAAAAAAAAIAAAAALALYIRSRSRADLALDVDDQPVRSVLDTAPASAAPASATASAAGEAEKASDEELREQAKRAKERGNKRFQGRQFQRAIEEYTEAINISPDKSHKDVSVFYGNRAQCFASLDKHAEAEADCDAALAIAPDYVKALCRRAIAREKQGKLEGALLDLTAASLLSGFTNEVAVTGADRVLKLVAQSKAERRLDEPMRHLPSASFISTFVDSFKLHRTLLGKPRRTVAAITAELTKQGSAAECSSVDAAVARARCLCERAHAYMSANDFESAFSDWLASCALIPTPSAVPSWTELPVPKDARPALDEKQLQQVLSTWKDFSSAKAPHVAPSYALTMAGMFLHLRGNYAEAMGCYDYALQLQPTSIEVLLKRASLWFEKEELPKALADFETAIGIDAGCADIFCHRGQLYILQNDLGSALADLRKAVSIDAKSVLARIQLGMALHRHGQQSEARRVFSEAEKEFPNSPEVLNYFGELLVESGEVDEAKAKFEKALSLSSSKFALAHVNLGVLQMHLQQDVEGAIKYCRRATEVDPLCETAHVHMAHLHLQMSNLKEAVVSYDKAVALLRMKQELVDCFSMREATAAQLALLELNPAVYGPAMEQHRARFAELAASNPQQ